MLSTLKYSQQFYRGGISISIFTEKGYERKTEWLIKLVCAHGVRTRQNMCYFCFLFFFYSEKPQQVQGIMRLIHGFLHYLFLKFSLSIHITPAVGLSWSGASLQTLMQGLWLHHTLDPACSSFPICCINACCQ